MFNSTRTVDLVEDPPYNETTYYQCHMGFTLNATNKKPCLDSTDSVEDYPEFNGRQHLTN